MSRVNASIAATLDEYAALLELAGAGFYSARAYRRAAELIRALPVPVDELVRAGRVKELRGIGSGIEAKLRELVETGRIAELEELRKETSPELAALGRMHGFGARLGSQIATVARRPYRRRAARRGRRGPTAGGSRHRPPHRGTDPGGARARRCGRRAAAAPPPRPCALGALAAALGGIPAGDARRWREASTRLAIVVVTERPDEVRARFQALPEIVTLAAPDLGVTLEGVPVELVLAQPERSARRSSAPPARPSTSPRSARCRRRPTRRPSTALLGRPCLPPELRELPAPPGEPPALVELEQIRGDLHCHTVWSDGKATVLEMGEAARALGYEYLAICDHTSNLKVVPGLDRGRPPSPGRGGRRRQRAAGAVPRAARHRVRHPPRRLASTSPTTSSPSSTGCRSRCTRDSARRGAS